MSVRQRGSRFAPGARALARLAMALAIAAAAPLAQGDVTPPTLIARSPAPGASSVATTINVQVTFSEAITPATLVMELRNSSNQLVASAVTYDVASRTATLNPNNDLTANQTFTVNVSGARDAANNQMAAVSWTFTTATTGFQDIVLPQTGLVDPTVMQFASDGRVFVGEKSGRVHVYDNLSDASPTLVIDLRTSVHNFWDRGLLGLALHPGFPAVPYIYVLYSYDATPGGSAPRWGTAGAVSDGCPNPPGATNNGCVITGRLARLNIGNPAAWPLMESSQQLLITDWYQQFPSHSIGALAFGADGALYASGGDGASFNYVDFGQTAANPSANDPANQGGALRSQDIRTSGDPVTLDGSIIRIDPDTGASLPDNPRVSDPDANGKRLVAYGLRNPFRFTVRPGTNELWIGDVGWNNWEEINRVVDGGDSIVENFGWPCYEGTGASAPYDIANLSICETLYGQSGTETRPYYTYNHGEQIAAGDGCSTGSSSVSGLAFYPQTGGTYPQAYRGALFFADYSRNCIWAMRPGANGLPNPADIVRVPAGAGGPVHLVSGPDGDIFYAGMNDDRLHRIRFSAGNVPPTAVLNANVTSGPLPLQIDFNATGSGDPEGQALSYAWDLDGDGAFDDGTAATASFTYTTAGAVTVRLRVSDPAGLSDVAARTVWPGNRAPTATIGTPAASLVWKVGDSIAFSGTATDPDEGTLPATAMQWSLIMHHCPSNCHTHDVQSFAGVSSGAFSAPDHEYPSHLELRLTVSDAGGLQSSASVLLQPQTVTLTFASNPAGLQLAVNGSAGSSPLTSTVIVGSNNSVSASSPQTLGGDSYVFSSWSDGGSQVHNLTAPASAATYTATFTRPVSTPGLIAGYAFDEGSGTTVSDVTGGGHTGTLTNVVWSASGRFGAALSFNGASSMVRIADAPALDFTNGMTLEAWVSPTALSGWRTVLLKERAADLAYALYAHDDSPRPAGYISTGGIGVAALGAGAIPLNTWTHLASTYDGTTLRMFVNGIQVGTRAVAGAIAVTNGEITIGGNDPWGEFFSGLIDEVRLYNRALSAAEIQTDMTTRLGGPPVPDTTPPDVTITSPAANATVSGTVTLTATATDNSGTVASVQFFVNGTPAGAPDTAAPFTASWNTTALSGSQSLTAVAIDGSGNARTSTAVSVTVDNSGPSVAITAPAAGNVAGTVTVTATASDSSGVASVQFRVDGANIGAADTTAPYSISWNTASVGNGAHALTAVAVDTAGNATSSAAVTVTVANIIDTTGPSVAITAPAAGNVAGTVALTATASDPAGVVSVQFRVDGTNLGAADTTAPYSVSWNTASVGNGAHALTAVAVDALGNTATSAAVTVTVANTWTVPSGLVAAYTFSEGAGTTTADASGNGRVGTLTGGVTWAASGRFGGGMTFNGTNALVSVADAASLDFTTSLTLEAWVRPTALSGWNTIVMKGGGLDAMAYALYANDSVPRPAGYVSIASVDRSAIGASGLPLNTWTHLAFTYGGGMLRLYVNGVQVGTRAITGNVRVSAEALTIGGNTVWGEWFTGTIDEVRLYNRELTAAEIQAGMAQTVGGS